MFISLTFATTKDIFCEDLKFLVSFAAGAANEGVLANFFNSLLSKKTGAPGSPGSGAVGAGVQGSAKKTGITSNSSVFSSDVSLFYTLFLTGRPQSIHKRKDIYI